MNYRYLSLIVLPFASLTAMEQGALVPQKPVFKAVPSLQELALRSYANTLYNNAPEGGLAEEELAEWGESMGLSVFYDKDLGNLLPRLKQVLGEPTVSKTNLKCPKIFSPDGRFEFFNDWKNSEQYFIESDEKSSIVYTHQYVVFAFHDALPIVSQNGKWIMGCEYKAQSRLVLMPFSACGTDLSSERIIKVSLDTWADYAFLDADTILVRTCRAIFMSSIADVVSKGTGALTQVYCRNDMRKYPSPVFFRTIYALSDSCIACVGPDKESIEILNRGADGLFSLAKTVVVPDISIGGLVVHNARGIAAMHVNSVDKTIHLCQLLGDDAGEKSTVEVANLENYLFSPSGEYLACGTSQEGQVVEIFDCRNLASPQRIQVIPQVVEMGPVQCMIWTDQMLIVRDGSSEKHTVTFNNAAPLIRAYTAYRERQEKEKATSKNAS